MLSRNLRRSTPSAAPGCQRPIRRGHRVRGHRERGVTVDDWLVDQLRPAIKTSVVSVFYEF